MIETGVSYSAEIAKKDYKAFLLFTLFKLRKIHLIYLPIFALLNLHGINSAMKDPENTLPLFEVILKEFFILSIIVSAVALIFYILFKLIKNQPVKSIGKHTWNIKKNVFRETNTDSSLEIKIENLKIYETKSHLFITSKNAIFMIIPRANNDYFINFYNELRQRIK